jgi:hydroxyquinol 1,2-dioxygenase
MRDINQFTITRGGEGDIQDRAGKPVRAASSRPDRTSARLHAREHQLTHEEWMKVLMFLYDCGQISTPERHEFILLSDVLGFSALVDMINTKGGATEGSNLGPFYLDDAPRKTLGANLADDREGVTILVHGKVTDSLHKPLPVPSSTPGRPTARAPTRSRSRSRDRTRWTCAACSRPTITAATGTRPSCRSPIPCPMTARSATFCVPATGMRGGPRTCTTSCVHPGMALDHHRDLLREHGIPRQRRGFRRAQLACGEGQPGKGRRRPRLRSEKKPDAVVEFDFVLAPEG